MRHLLAAGVVAILLLASGPHDGSDLKIEWVTTRAAFDGLDVSLPVDALAAHYGVTGRFLDVIPPGAVDPGTPGGLILQAPLTLIPFEWVATIGVVLNVAAAYAFGFVIGRMSGWEWWPLMVPVVLASSIGQAVLELGQTSLLVAALVGWAAHRGSGVPLGVATTLKVFPALAIVGFWVAGRRKAAIAAVTAGAGLNLAGLLLPGVRNDSLIEWVTAGSDMVNHYWNGSPVAFGVPSWLVALIGVVGVAAMWKMGDDRSIRSSLPLGLLIAPLSWWHYGFVLAVALAGSRWLPVLVAAWFVPYVIPGAYVPAFMTVGCAGATLLWVVRSNVKVRLVHPEVVERSHQRG